MVSSDTSTQAKAKSYSRLILLSFCVPVPFLPEVPGVAMIGLGAKMFFCREGPFGKKLDVMSN